MNKYTISDAEHKGNPEDLTALLNILNDHSSKAGHIYKPEPLAIFLRDEDSKLMGGLTGSTNWGWLYIDLLAVHETLRGKGFGKQLLERAEDIAIARKCRFSHVCTFTFQALPFYQKMVTKYLVPWMTTRLTASGFF